MSDDIVQRQVAYLYKFSFKGLDYTFTSYDLPIVYDQQTYTRASIVHSEIDAETKAVTITTAIENAILRRFFLSTQITRFSLTIYRVTEKLEAPETVYQIFCGDMTSVSFKNNLAAATFAPRNLRASEKSVPRCFVQGACNWVVFSPGCGLDPMAYLQSHFPVVSVDRYTRTIVVSDMTLEDPTFLDYGKFTFSHEGQFETNTILTASTTGGLTTLFVDDIPLELTGPPFTISIVPGCDRTAATCNSRYSNLANFGGFDMIPDYNPTIDGIKTTN